MHGYVSVKPRRLVADDIPWMTDLACRRFKPFDVENATRWMVHLVLPNYRNMYLALRTADAFLVAAINEMPWNLSESVVVVLTMVTEPHATWQGVRLLRASVEWARVRKAVRWQYHFDDRDAGPLLRRIGAAPMKYFYGINLCHSPGS